MSQLERQQQILRLLEAHPSLTVREISGTLFYSESSVRRDVRELEARGLVTHRWGGVMLTSDSTGVVPVTLREEENSAVKERLARDAAARVRDGDTLLLDSSSTVRRMLPYLAERRDLRLITNNRRVFEMDMPKSFRLFCTGGAYGKPQFLRSGSRGLPALGAGGPAVLLQSGAVRRRRNQRRLGGRNRPAPGDAHAGAKADFSVRFLQVGCFAAVCALLAGCG